MTYPKKKGPVTKILTHVREMFTNTDGLRSIRCESAETEEAAMTISQAEVLQRIANGECICAPVPEHLHTTHYGARDPATTTEWDPACPQHSDLAVSLAAQIHAVRDLHERHPDDCQCIPRGFHGDCFSAGACDGCGRDYPCPTIRALDGEDA